MLELTPTQPASNQPELTLDHPQPQNKSTPPPGDIYAALWHQYQKAIQFSYREISRLAQIEQDRFSYAESCYCVFHTNSYAVDSQIRDKADELFDGLIHLAERRFAPPGSSLHIETYVLRQQYLPQDRAEFNPVKLWDALEEQYGGQAGIDTAYRQAASELVHFFAIKRDTPTQTKKGHLVLNTSVWTDDLYKSLNHENRLSFTCQRHLNDGCTALGSFAEWAGESSLRLGLEEFRTRFSAHCHAVYSRESIRLGDGACVVTYLSRFEFRFTQELGEQLQVFISTYGADALAHGG
jgi:hypothetical protein